MLTFVLFAASRVIITEVMSNPAGSSGAHEPEDRNEFIELYNPGSDPVDLYGWTIDDGDRPDGLTAWNDSSILVRAPEVIINSTWLAPGGYAVVLDSEYTDPLAQGGHVEPYRFSPGTLVLSTPNTTLGDGLAVNDPLVLSSRYGDTSTFGTPEVPDGFPDNPGDGWSWERIRADRPDTVSNWAVCRDSAGCTPGRASSVALLVDLALLDLVLLNPESLGPERPFRCQARVANQGPAATDDWCLELFLDRNGNSRRDQGENWTSIPGLELEPDQDSALIASLVCPGAKTDLWADLVCPADQDTIDNRCRINVEPSGRSRILNLSRSSFSPNGDGFEDSLEIIYRLPKTDGGGTRGKLTAAIYDLGGRPVRMYPTTTTESDQGALYWDGRDEDGNPLAAGIYAVWLQYRRPNFNREEKLPVVLCRR